MAAVLNKQKLEILVLCVSLLLPLPLLAQETCKSVVASIADSEPAKLEKNFFAKGKDFLKTHKNNRAEALKALIAEETGTAQAGSCFGESKALAVEIFKKSNGAIRLDLYGSYDHYHLRYGDLWIDPTYMQFFNSNEKSPFGRSDPPVFIGTRADFMKEIEKRIQAKGFNRDLVDPKIKTAQEFVDAYWTKSPVTARGDHLKFFQADSEAPVRPYFDIPRELESEN